MDLETENRIAAILLKEAAELRRQSEREGVLAYLQKPNVRGRPNSRFLTATVLGVQQANRAVEVNEMWRIRRKEQELEDRLAGRSKDVRNSDRSSRHIGESSGGARKEAADCVKNARAGSLSDRIIDDSCSSMAYGGPRDGELQDFLLSKAKRGRGSVGPRMDEAGPYLAHPGSKRRLSLSPESWVQGKQEPRMILAPEKPVSLKCDESSEEESDRDSKKKAKKSKSGNSKKQHSRKRTSKEKSKDRKRKRKDKRSKY